jgi:hypothetical protein
MSDVLLHKHAFRLLAVPLMLAVSACSTVMNPYLDTGQAANRPACASTQTCTPRERFIAVRNAAETAQDRARTGYVERARINSWSSALALPLTGALLYGGATRSSEGARKGLLGLGLAVASGYEARNILLSGSPEGVYMLAEVRLACVVDEAYKYNLAPVSVGCGGRQTALAEQIRAVQKLKPTAEMSVKRDAYLARANGALTQYEQLDQTISAAADHMQAATRTIVADSNFQIKTASLSPSAATALLKSELAIISPGSKLDPSKAGSPTGNDDTTSDKDVIDALNLLVDRIGEFAQACVKPQPSSPAAFDACTTYSPAVPPAPTLTTTLPANAFEMSPGATVSFTVTSKPTGTPWADFSGDVASATAALGRPQIVTLTPTQSQITLNYAKAVPKETTVVLSLTTLGVVGNVLPLTITLTPDAAPTDAGKATAMAVTTSAQKFDRLKGDACLMAILKVPGPYKPDAIKDELAMQWRNTASGEPTDEQLTSDVFIGKLKASPKLNPNKCN